MSNLTPAGPETFTFRVTLRKTAGPGVGLKQAANLLPNAVLSAGWSLEYDENRFEVTDVEFAGSNLPYDG